MQPTLDEVIRWAKEAGALLRQGFGQHHDVRYKGLIDPVTEMDRASEALLLERIREAFPHHAIISEESGTLTGHQAHRWYIDPLDGTVNYAHGLPIFAVSVAYFEGDQPCLGVVYDPMRDECFYAERGKGAFLNGQPVRVSTTPDLIHALLVTGFPYDLDGSRPDNLDLFATFTRRTQGVRRLGSAALDLCYVASGRLDGYWELELAPWDLAAGVLIAREAGALITRLNGEPDVLQPPYDVLAANPYLHQQMLALIAESGYARVAPWRDDGHGAEQPAP